MNKQPTPVRELLIPILLGGFSLVGIAAVLIIGRALSAPAEIAATPSSTPFQYIYLGTEPAITTLGPDESELPVTEAPITDEPVTEPAVFETSTRGPFSTPVILPNRTATGSAPRTNTPSAANTYDDTDARLIYSPSGKWTVQTGLPTTGTDAAYNGTLHISSEADGKSVTVQFSGQEFYFYYQAASSFGMVAIYLDNDPLAYTTVSEAQGGVWHHVFEQSSTHIVKIVHPSIGGGGSVNIDKFVIPAATPTP